MLSNTDLYQEIAFEVAFFAQFYRIAVADTFGDRDLLFDIFVLNAVASAACAELLNFGAFSITRVASGLHDERPLPHSLGACAIARVALCRVCSGFALAAFACFALDRPSVLNRLQLKMLIL